MQQQQPVTDVELVDALARRRRGLPPPPSQSFTVHDGDDVFIFIYNPSNLYSTPDTTSPCNSHRSDTYHHP